MFPNLLRRSLAGLSFEGGFLPSALDRRAVLVALGGLLLAPVLGAYVADEPSLAAALVIAFGVGVVVLGRPHWAAYGVCFGMFFSHTGIRVGVAYLDPGDLFSMALVPLWLLHRFSGSMRPRLISTWWLIPALLGWMLVSMLISGIPSGVMGRFTREIQMLLTTLALMDLLAQEDRLKIAFWLVAIAAGVEVVLALPEFGTAYRVGGAYKQANQFAHSVAVGAIPVVALFTMYRRRWLRFSLLGLLGFMLLGVRRARPARSCRRPCPHRRRSRSVRPDRATGRRSPSLSAPAEAGSANRPSPGCSGATARPLTPVASTGTPVASGSS